MKGWAVFLRAFADALAHPLRQAVVEPEMDPDRWPCIMTANHTPHTWFPTPGKIAQCPGKPRSEQ